MASNHGTITFNSDLTGDRWQTDPERHVSICRQDDRVRAAARRAVGVSRRIVVGVDDRFDQRTLAIRYDAWIVCGDSDRGRRRRSLTQREQ